MKIRQTRRRNAYDFADDATEQEFEDAELFWETLTGESTTIRASGNIPLPNPPPSRPRYPSRSRMVTRCVSPTRLPDFGRNVTPTHNSINRNICKLLVIQRGQAIRRHVVDPDGRRPEQPTPPSEEPGAGGLRGRNEVNSIVPGLIHAMGTGFFIAPDKIVTAAHVVLDAVQVVVIPGKMGPGQGRHSEPFGRFQVCAREIAIYPRLISLVKSRHLTNEQFYANDIAVIHKFNFRPRTPARFGQVYRLAGPLNTTACVQSCGYSGVTTDPNFQHCDRGFRVRNPAPVPGAPLVHFDLISEQGASGAPIWQDASNSQRRVVGIVIGGLNPQNTFSSELDPQRITWLRNP